METKKKLLYEPPVMEVFEIKVENVLLPASQTGLRGGESYESIGNDPFLDPDNNG